MAIGDDWTDEDLFKVLPDTGYSIKLGMNPSHARFNMTSQVDVHRLIKEMIE